MMKEARSKAAAPRGGPEGAGVDPGMRSKLPGRKERAAAAGKAKAAAAQARAAVAGQPLAAPAVGASSGVE